MYDVNHHIRIHFQIGYKFHQRNSPYKGKSKIYNKICSYAVFIWTWYIDVGFQICHPNDNTSDWFQIVQHNRHNPVSSLF